MAMQIDIDNGGTLTDVCVISGKNIFHAKSLTTPYDLSECFVSALRSASQQVYGEEDLERLLRETDHLRYSTTEGTNRIVQRDGPRLGLILSKGIKTRELQVGGSSEELFEMLVGDRVRHVDPSQKPTTFEKNVVAAVNELMAQGSNRLVVSLGGHNSNNARDDEQLVKDIVLRRYPRHLLGAVPVLFSREMVNHEDNVRRTWTGLLNAFLHLGMERFLYNAENILRARHVRKPMLIYGNDGTSKRVAKTVALKTLGSGPRGGSEGGRALARHYGLKRCLTLDVGGTTADIGVIEAHDIPEQRRGSIEGIPISLSLPQVTSIGVGGSSVMRAKGKKLTIGPDSVGSTPGPACFARGGTQATITDANLLIGLIDAKSYSGGTVQLDAARAEQAIKEQIAEPLSLSLDAALNEMVQTFEQAVADGIKTQVKKVADVSLLAYGGAGPMNACGIAGILGVKNVIVPRLASVFSAFGMGFSDIAHTYSAPLESVNAKHFKAAMDAVREEAERGMFAEGYALTDCQLEFELEYGIGGKDQSTQVKNQGKPPKLPKGASNINLRLSVHKDIPGCSLEELKPKRKTMKAKATGKRKILGDDGERADLPVYRVEDMKPGSSGEGPAIVEEAFFTCRVPAGWSFTADENLNIQLRSAA